MKHSILDTASGLQKQRFLVLCPGPQPEKQVDPSLFSQPLQPCRCHTQLTFGPPGMLPGKEKIWGLCGPVVFQSSYSSTLPEAFALPQPASAEQLVCASYPDMEIPG